MYSTNQGLILYFLEELQLQFFFIMEMDVLVLRFSYQGRQITGLEYWFLNKCLVLAAKRTARIQLGFVVLWNDLAAISFRSVNLPNKGTSIALKCCKFHG
jgi:hypothetical protein